MLQDRCLFAHGDHELRSRKCNPRYKTKACSNFLATGICHYADRCDFLHDERRVSVNPQEFWLVESKQPENIRMVKVDSKAAFPQPIKGVPKALKAKAWQRRGPIIILLALLDQGRATVKPLAPPPAINTTLPGDREDKDGAVAELIANFQGTSWLARASDRLLVRHFAKLGTSLRRDVLLFL